MDLVAWAASIVERLGYVGVALLVALESVVPPIPSEVVLPLAGYSVSQARLAFWPVVVAATLGSLAGALALYALGRRVGTAPVRRWASRHGGWLLLDTNDVDRAEAWFARRGGRAVLLGRLAPGLRSYVSLPAGAARMPLARFTLLTALGSLAWNAALTWLGVELGARWHLVAGYVDTGGWIVWTLLGLLVAVFVARRVRRRRRDDRAPAA